MLMFLTCRPHRERWKRSEKIIGWESFTQITYIWIYDCKLYNKAKEVNFRTLELQNTYRNIDLWTAEFLTLNIRKLGYLYSTFDICNFLLYFWRENSSVLVLSKLPVLIINRNFVQWILTEMALFVLNDYLFSVRETLQLYLLVVLDHVCLIFLDIIYLSTLVVTQKI